MRPSIVRGTVGSSPTTVFFWKSTIMPMFIISEAVRAPPPSAYPYASVTVASAACAVGPVTIAVRAMTHVQVRSIGET